MNKLYGQGSKGAVLACILEPGNLHNLQQRKPIAIDLNDGPWKNGLPPKIELVIAYSETPIADKTRFTDLFPQMEVEDRRTPVTESKKPHCAECHSTIEQLGVWTSDQSPLWIAFCATCGCVYGVTQPVPGLERKK